MLHTTSYHSSGLSSTSRSASDIANFPVHKLSYSYCIQLFALNVILNLLGVLFQREEHTRLVSANSNTGAPDCWHSVSVLYILPAYRVSVQEESARQGTECGICQK